MGHERNKPKREKRRPKKRKEHPLAPVGIRRSCSTCLNTYAPPRSARASLRCGTQPCRRRPPAAPRPRSLWPPRRPWALAASLLTWMEPATLSALYRPHHWASHEKLSRFCPIWSTDSNVRNSHTAVSVAVGGIAATGTVVLAELERADRLLFMLARRHVVLLPVDGSWPASRCCGAHHAML